MAVMGPDSPSEKTVEEATSLVLELLKEKYGCLKNPEVRFIGELNLRKHRIQKLRDAIHDMIELEHWEMF